MIDHNPNLQENTRFDDVTKYTWDQKGNGEIFINIENQRTNPSIKTEMSTRQGKISSRAFTNRLNTFYNSNENLQIEEWDNNRFVTLNTLTIGNHSILNNEDEKFIDNSK